MTKIAIISQPEQGVLIDVGGCASVTEATQHLASTFEVTNQFWTEQPVDVDLGALALNRDEVAQILSTLSEAGVKPRHFFARAASTKAALRAHQISPSEAAREKESAKEQEGLSTTSGAMATVPPANLGEGASPICETQTETPQETVSHAGGTAGETAVAARAAEDQPQAAKEEPAAAHNQKAPDPAPAKPHVLYLHQTLRSGQSLTHKGHLVIIGDVNPGAEVTAEGDITIWGVLRGVAHAGVGGNTSAEIRALRFDPLQLRIAHAIARAPDRPRPDKRLGGPEVARVVNGTIRISSCAPD